MHRKSKGTCRGISGTVQSSRRRLAWGQLRGGKHLLIFGKAQELILPNVRRRQKRAGDEGEKAVICIFPQSGGWLGPKASEEKNQKGAASRAPGWGRKTKKDAVEVKRGKERKKDHSL